MSKSRRLGTVVTAALALSLALPLVATADTVRAAGWSGQTQVGGGTSHGPTFAAFGSRLYLGWKGVPNDPRMFYTSSPDGL